MGQFRREPRWVREWEVQEGGEAPKLKCWEVTGSRGAVLISGSSEGFSAECAVGCGPWLEVAFQECSRRVNCCPTPPFSLHPGCPVGCSCLPPAPSTMPFLPWSRLPWTEPTGTISQTNLSASKLWCQVFYPSDGKVTKDPGTRGGKAFGTLGLGNEVV